VTTTTTATRHDIDVLRRLAERYMEIATAPVQDERRRLWADHNSLRPTRVLVLATYGMWNVWCREVFGDGAMQCADPFYREYERTLRMRLFQHGVGDDFILEPWLTVWAARGAGWDDLWGLPFQYIGSGVEGGAWKFNPSLRDWSDARKLVAPRHHIDEQATARDRDRLGEAVGDIIEVSVDRGPACQGFMADISTHLTRLRGLEQFMMDMYDAPERLHEVLAFMRDGILANQAAAEQAGDLGLCDQQNQCMPYCHELKPPQPNCCGAKRKDLWAFAAAQEFTLISPAMHEEFMLRYQKPILESWGLSAYGCCEDLTNKIDMLRQVSNLRIIAVTPRADVARSAEQIGTDYVLSWRPNPADVICCGFDESRIRRIIGEGLAAARGCRVHVHLKDVETVEGEPDRLARWVRIVRDVAERV